MLYKQKSGFTLIELLIAMSILAILATIGFGNFQSARLKAADAKKKSDLSTIAKSLEAYVNDHRVYPSSSASGEIICQPPNTTCAWGTAFTDGSTLYAAILPEPATAYVYESNGTEYTLYTRLENLQDPAIIVTTIDCGGVECNYKITSSNTN